ncbi:hypothetical protein [Actinocorallia libanotica]|uniref:HEAT repeat protein n=1 Tax=Actinocorallia libanotica TaxID=46162 RepID=A0ABN1QNR8_9ACTN
MDAEGGAAVAAEVLADPWAGGRALWRVEAVAALLASEGRWTPVAPLDSLVGDPGALDVVVAALARRDAWGVACELVEAALLRACSGDGRGLYEAFWAAERLCGEFRAAPGRLLPALSAVLAWRGEGPHVPPWTASLPGDAAELIGSLGTDAAPARDALVVLAGDASSPANADRALAALIRLGDDRGTSLLAADLPCRPLALRSAVEHGLPFSSVLLPAVRERLRVASEPSADGSERPAPTGPEREAERFLLALLRSWGPEAHEAVPELCGLLERKALPDAAARTEQRQTPVAGGASAPEKKRVRADTDDVTKRPAAISVSDGGALEQVCATLAAIGDSSDGREQVKAVLRRVVAGGEARARLAASRALWRLTGDALPVLAEAAVLLSEKGARADKALRPDAAEACRELGEEARPLLPVLLRLLARPKPRRLPWLVDVAVAVWRLTGETEHVRPVLDAALAAPDSGPKAVRAVRELGPAAASLAEHVAHRLYDLYELPETVRALIRVCSDAWQLPEGCSPIRLIDLLLTNAGEARDPLPAFEVITEVGVAHLTEVHRRLLHRYATQDQRVPRKHSSPDIAADTALRAASQALLNLTAR